MDNSNEEYMKDEQEAAFEGDNQEAADFDYEEQVGPRRRKRRKKKRYILKICVFLLLCVGVFALLHSSLFTVAKISVSKSVGFTAEEIKDTAGIKIGMQLFSFSAGKAEDKLEADSRVAKADISRKVFSGVVSIRIVERIEAAAIKVDDQYAIIDREGYVLKLADQEPKLTIIKGLTVKEAQEGQSLQVKEGVPFKHLKEILAVAEGSGLYFKTLDVSNTVVKGYFTDKLYCRGKSQHIVEGIKKENLQAVVYDLTKKKVKKGIISVGEDQYYSYRPKEKN